MLLEVCGQNRLDDKEAETLELDVVQVGQEVEFGLGQVEAPSRRGVVVLQHRAVIVQHRLHHTEEKSPQVREGRMAP